MKISLPRIVSMAALLLVATACLNAQDWAKAKLEASPRHREYVTLKHGDRTLQAYVAYPEVSTKAPVIVMVFEAMGLSDWAKMMTDEMAAQGFIVITPDLVSGLAPNGGGTSDFPSQDATIKAVTSLSLTQILADLDAAADYGKKLPSSDGKLAVVGFCWGGNQAFAFATQRKDLSAAVVFYGTAPSDVSSITAPVYGYYGSNDNRVTSTVPATVEAMKAAGKTYETVIYDGAGHGFMHSGEDPANKVPGNKTAYEQGFESMIKHLKEMKRAPMADIQSVNHDNLATAKSEPAVQGHDMAEMGAK